MAGKKSRQKEQTGGSAREKTGLAASKSRPSLTVVALVAFGLGFLTGVGFTVYKTGSQAPVAMTQPPESGAGQMEMVLAQKVEQNPEDAESWAQLGHIYFDSERYPKAVDAYERSLAISPNNPNVLTDLGVMYRRTDRPKKAIESFDRAIALDPKHETARFNKGIVLLHDMGDRVGAIAAWESLVAVNPVAMTPGGQSVDEMVTEMKKLTE